MRFNILIFVIKTSQYENKRCLHLCCAGVAVDGAGPVGVVAEAAMASCLHVADAHLPPAVMRHGLSPADPAVLIPAAVVVVDDVLPPAAAAAAAVATQSTYSYLIKCGSKKPAPCFNKR